MSQFDNFSNALAAERPANNQDLVNDLNFEIVNRHLADAVAQSQRSLIMETLPPSAYGEVKQFTQPPTTEETDNAVQAPSESGTAMTSRLLLSVGAGHLTALGMCLSGIRSLPKIGLPLTVVTPFVAAGITSSYLKTNTLSDARSIGEGVIAYGAFGGLGHVGRQFEQYAYSASSPITHSTRMVNISSDMVRQATVRSL